MLNRQGAVIKIPNNNDSLFNQAKYVLYQQQTKEGGPNPDSITLSEIGLI